MGAVLNRLLQTVRFERDAFVWMDFNDRSTGDAFVLVLISRFIIYLGFGGSFLGVVTNRNLLAVLFLSLLNAAWFWLLYSGATYAIIRFLFQGEGNYAFYLRATGFAYPTLLLTIVTFRLDLTAVAALLLGSIWLIAIMTRAVQYGSDLPMAQAFASAAGGMLAWIIFALVWGRGLI
jgi:hypothetical protein